MPSEISQADLARVRDWAEHQLADGREQPWSAFLLRRLGETLDALLAGMEATSKSQPSSAACQAAPRLVVSNVPRDSDRRSMETKRSQEAERALACAKAKPPVTEPVI